MRNRRALLALAPVALLPACGFHLRGLPEFGFASLYIEAPPGSPLAQQLQRALEGAGTKLLVLREPAAMASAQAILDLLQEQQERTVVGLSAAGQVREMQLRLRVRFRLRNPQGVALIPETELLLQRDISYNETIALAKEAEEALLYRDMRTDLVQQLMRRLAAAKPSSSKTVGHARALRGRQCTPAARPTSAKALKPGLECIDPPADEHSPVPAPAPSPPTPKPPHPLENMVAQGRNPSSEQRARGHPLRRSSGRLVRLTLQLLIVEDTLPAQPANGIASGRKSRAAAGACATVRWWNRKPEDLTLAPARAIGRRHPGLVTGHHNRRPEETLGGRDITCLGIANAQIVPMATAQGIRASAGASGGRNLRMHERRQIAQIQRRLIDTLAGDGQIKEQPGARGDIRVGMGTPPAESAHRHGLVARIDNPLLKTPAARNGADRRTRIGARRAIVINDIHRLPDR